MVDRPIIFSGAMVRALLDGRKTQTRRLATSPLRRCAPGDRLWVRETCRAVELDSGCDCIEYAATVDCECEWGGTIENTPEAGEQWGCLTTYGSGRMSARSAGGIAGPWVPSIHMPRWASRLTLVVEAVRVEPLQAIGETDAIAEGVSRHPRDDSWYVVVGDLTRAGCGWTARDAYWALWSELHGAESWAANPDVLVLTFRVVRGNIDQVPA